MKDIYQMPLKYVKIVIINDTKEVGYGKKE